MKQALFAGGGYGCSSDDEKGPHFGAGFGDPDGGGEGSVLGASVESIRYSFGNSKVAMGNGCLHGGWEGDGRGRPGYPYNGSGFDSDPDYGWLDLPQQRSDTALCDNGVFAPDHAEDFRATVYACAVMALVHWSRHE